MPSDASFIAEMSVLGVGLITILGASYMLTKSDNNYYSKKSKTSSKSRSSNLTRRRTTSSDKYSITYKSRKSNSSKQ
jgi:hypothetical protein